MPKDAYFHRWSHLIAIFALIISLISLWKSIQSVEQKSTPNVQFLNIENYIADTPLDNGTDYYLHKEVLIGGKLTIKNFGSAPAQLVKVICEPLFFGQPVDTKKIKFGISDRLVIPTPLSKLEQDPILGINDPVIPAGAVRHYEVKLVIDAADVKEHVTGKYRILLIFSNGQCRV